MEKQIKVNGMKCEGCAATVKEKFLGLAAVEHVSVDLTANTVYVKERAAIPAEAFEQALANTKYKIAEIN